MRTITDTSLVGRKQQGENDSELGIHIRKICKYLLVGLSIDVSRSVLKDGIVFIESVIYDIVKMNNNNILSIHVKISMMLMNIYCINNNVLIRDSVMLSCCWHQLTTGTIIQSYIRTLYKESLRLVSHVSPGQGQVMSHEKRFHFICVSFIYGLYYCYLCHIFSCTLLCVVYRIFVTLGQIYCQYLLITSVVTLSSYKLAIHYWNIKFLLNDYTLTHGSVSLT